jgi:hypothetical protein
VRRPWPAHIGNQHQRTHGVLHGFAQVGGRLQRFDHRRQRIGVFQVVRVEVHEQQGQRLHQFGVGQRHQRRKGLHRGGETRHPGQQAFAGLGVVIQLVDPGVKPVALADGAVQLGVAAQHQRLQFLQRRARPAQGGFQVGHQWQPLAGGTRLGCSSTPHR